MQAKIKRKVYYEKKLYELYYNLAKQENQNIQNLKKTTRNGKLQHCNNRILAGYY